MNAETAAAIYVGVKTGYDRAILRSALDERTRVEREDLALSMFEFSPHLPLHSNDRFGHATNTFFNALGRVIRNEGRRQGLRHWQTDELLVSDDSAKENTISGSLDKSGIALSQGIVTDRGFLTYHLRRDSSGVISAGIDYIEKGILIPVAQFSSESGTGRDRAEIGAMVLHMGTDFLRGLSPDDIDSEDLLTPEEKVRYKLLKAQEKWQSVEVRSVKKVFAMARDVGDALTDAVLMLEPDEKKLKLSHGKIGRGAHTLAVELAPSGSLFINRNVFRDGNLLIRGVSEGDQIDLRMGQGEEGYDIISGVVNTGGFSTPLTIRSTDEDHQNINAATNALRRIMRDSVAFIG